MFCYVLIMFFALYALKRGILFVPAFFSFIITSVTAFLLILSGAILGGAPGIIAVYYNYTNLSKKKTIVMIGVSICVGGALFLIASGLENNLLSVICSTVLF